MVQLSPIFDHAEMLIPPFPWDRPQVLGRSGEKVVLLHGLWRGFHAMAPLARKLSSSGFQILNLPYPSSRKSIDAITPTLREKIQTFAGEDPVHLVTHSLGGILSRVMIDQGVSWKLGRLVMIAPPSQGSEIVDWAEDKRLMRWFLGPAGRSLGANGVPASLKQIPTDLTAGVIMGSRSRIRWFRKVLAEENDGIVSVDHGRIPGLAGFITVDADHTFIQVHPDTVRQTVYFLQNGKFQAEENHFR